jgi:hypothetical protein
MHLDDPSLSTVVLADMNLAVRDHQQRLRREADDERLAHGRCDAAADRAARPAPTPTRISTRRLAARVWNRS